MRNYFLCAPIPLIFVPTKTAQMAKKKEAKAVKDKSGSKEYAFILYMQKVAQKDIAERVGVSEKTISEWKKVENWEAKRAAKTISMDTLIAKALARINTMLDEKDFNADGFAKAVSQLKTLKHRNTVDDEIMCFMDFQNWIVDNRQIEKIEEGFIKLLTRLQDAFIQHRIGNHV